MVKDDVSFDRVDSLDIAVNEGPLRQHRYGQLVLHAESDAHVLLANL